MTPSTQTITTTPSPGAKPAAPSPTEHGAAAPGAADTPRIAGELAARLLRSSRWQQ
jgi:hypothetical protein